MSARLLAAVYLAAAGLGAAQPAPAAPLTLTVTLEGASAPAPVRVEAVARRAGGTEVYRARREVTGPTVVLALALTPGEWRIRVSAAGFWPYEITRASASADTLALTLRRSGRIVAELRAPGDGAALRGVSVSLRDAAAPLGDERAENVDCQARDARLACELPAGRWHLRLATPGYAPVYLWDLGLEPDATLDLERLRLVPGASIAGFVERLDGLAPGVRARARLLSRTGAPVESAGVLDEPVLRGVPRVDAGAGVGAHGFFQLRGLAPGEYRVRADDGGLASPSEDVVVRAGEEARLRAALVLGEPRTLDVLVRPPLTPRGGTWTLTLARAEGLRRRTSTEETVAAHGHVRLQATPGDYDLVLRGDGQQWFGETVRIGAEPGPLTIELPLLALRGRVRLGTRALAARLRLRHPQGRAEVLIESDALGRFEGHVPGPGRWEAEVESSDPPFTRALAPLDLRAAAGTDTAEVYIVLPATLLRGVVVDEHGAAVAQASVRVLASPLPGLSEALTDAAGAFELSGLPPGRLVLMAETGGLRSDEARVELRAADDTAPAVRLVARPMTRVRGQVVGEGGRPLPGAWVRATAADDPLPLAGASLYESADQEARFDLALAPGARRAWLALAVPGYALRLVSTQVPAPDGWTVALSRASGKLAVEFDRPWEPGQDQVLIEGDGAREPLLVLFALSSAPHGVAWDARRVLLPALTPGRYRACRASLADYRRGAPGWACTEGEVRPGGELSLRLP